MPEPVFDIAPEGFRLHRVSHLSTPARGPLRAFPGRLGSWGPDLDHHTRKLTADGWADLPFPSLWLEEKPVCITAASDGVVFVDRRGALYKMADAGGLQKLAPPWGGLIGLSGHEARLVCDAVSDRLVLWDGDGRRTWAFSAGTWAELDGRQPHGGQSLLCPTPRGVYLLSGTHLWLLDGDWWQPVAEAGAGWRASLLWWPPGQDGLWALSDDSIVVWTAAGPRPVPGPPLPTGRRGSYYENSWDQVVSTGYDPVNNALLWYMEYEDVGAGSAHATYSVPRDLRTSVLWLDGCPLPSAALPPSRPGLFTSPSPDTEPAAEQQQRRSVYVVEVSIHLQTDLGFFYVTADRDEVRHVLEGEHPPATARDIDEDWAWRYEYLEDGLTVCVWTVQEGLLAHGLDVTPYLTILNPGWAGDPDSEDSDSADDGEPPRVAADWDAISTRLPALRAPVGPPVNDGFSEYGADRLGVLLVGPHPAPEIGTYLDGKLGDAAFKYGLNGLLDFGR